MLCLLGLNLPLPYQKSPEKAGGIQKTSRNQVDEKYEPSSSSSKWCRGLNIQSMAIDAIRGKPALETRIIVTVMQDCSHLECRGCTAAS